MNAPSVRRWSHRFMAKLMGLSLIMLGILIIVVFGTSQFQHASCGMTFGSFLLAAGGILCIA